MSIARIALLGAAAAILSVSSAEAQGGQIQAGVCRAATCPCTQAQMDRGMVDTPQGCTACDEAALQAAREEFYHRYGVAEDQANMSRDLHHFAVAADRETQEIYHSFLGKKALDYVGGKLWGKVPEPLRTASQTGIAVYSAETPEDGIKASVNVAKGMSDHLKDKASWAKTGSQAFKKASWGSLLVDLGFLGAMMGTKYQEAETYAKGAVQSFEAYKESIEKAVEAKEKWDALFRACQAQKPATPAPAEPAPSELSPDQSDVQAASDLLQSWQRLGGLYEDAHGNIYAGEALAWERALEVVRSGGQSGAVPARAGAVRFAAMVGVGRSDDEFSPDEVTAFVDHMTMGFEGFARTLELQLLIQAEVARIARLSELVFSTGLGFASANGGGQDSPDMIQRLMGFVADTDAVVQAAAARDLARVGSPAVPALRTALTDSAAAEPLRAAARSALVQIGQALGTGLTVEVGEGLAQPFSWSIVPAGAAPAAYVVSSRGADGGLQSVPPGRYDLYWAPEYAQRDEPTLIASGVEVTDSEPLSLRMGPALRMERAEWVPRLDGSGWWGVVPVGVAPSERTSWTNGHDALALPPGRYDVYWVQGYAQRDRPLLLAAGVAVAAGRPTVIPAAAGIRLTFRGDPPTVGSSGWWGAVPAGGEPEDPINWSAGRLDLPILLPPGTYDVYWKAGYGAEPELKTARVAVGANRLVLIDWETGRTRSVAGAGSAAASTTPAWRGLALILAAAFGVLGAGGVLVVRLRSRLRPGVL